MTRAYPAAKEGSRATQGESTATHEISAADWLNEHWEAAGKPHRNNVSGAARVVGDSVEGTTVVEGTNDVDAEVPFVD